MFDPEKLLWMNSQYIAKMPAEELLERSISQAPGGLPERPAALKAIELHRPRVRTLVEMGRALRNAGLLAIREELGPFENNLAKG